MRCLLCLLWLVGCSDAFLHTRGSPRLQTCGDGVVDADEECDDGPDNSDSIPNACRTSCLAPGCGDGVRDAGEDCDSLRVDECNPDCTAWLWSVVHDGGGRSADAAFDVAVDSRGNAVIAGYETVVPPYWDALIAKYSSTGELLWKTSFDGVEKLRDIAYAIGVDSQDNIVAAGYTIANATAADLWVAKYSPDGERLWLRLEPEPQDQIGFAVAFDDDDNLLVGGRGLGYQSGRVWKLTPEGDEIWATTNPMLEVHGVATFRDGAAVALSTQGLTKLRSDGSVAWTRPEVTMGEYGEVAVGDDGYIYVTGSAYMGFQKLAVSQLDADGQRGWGWTSYGGVRFGLGFGITIDAAGDLLVTGVVDAEGESKNIWLGRLSSTGEEIWQRTADYARGPDMGHSIATDADGNLFVAGQVYSNEEGLNVWLRKYLP